MTRSWKSMTRDAAILELAARLRTIDEAYVVGLVRRLLEGIETQFPERSALKYTAAADVAESPSSKRGRPRVARGA